jgi:hypothetical protein
VWSLPLLAAAQVTFVPLAKDTQGVNKRSSNTLQDTIRSQIPYFEDFATSFQTPDTTRWINSENVSITSEIGINPPTINAAVLNGINASGRPYSPGVTLVDSVDALTSQVIELGNVDLLDIPSVYMSFFWQAEGRAELPDSRDSLVLQFKDANGEWISVWSVIGGREKRSEQFNIEIFPINAFATDENIFFHNDFQFLFQAYGNPSGAFDFWLVDYIFIDRGRTLSDTTFQDQAWTSRPSSVLGSYSAVPLEHVKTNPFDSLFPASIGYFNLINPGDVNFFPAEVTGTIIDRQTDMVVDTLNIPGDDVNFPNSDIQVGGFQLFTFESNPARAPFLNDYLNATTDSIVELETFFFLESDSEININDTVRSTLTFSDFYAYDDGTAEEAIRLEQASGQLAQRYVVRTPDILSAIYAYFPPSTANSSGTIRFRIWESDRGNPGRLLYEDQADRTVAQIASGALDDFILFTVDEINVADTVWVGYVQSSNDLLGVGYDRNNNQKSEIRFNVGGEWERLDTLDSVDPPGNLMIRPVFRNSLLTAIEPIPDHRQILVYPNPSTGIFHFSEPLEIIEIFTLTGVKIYTGTHVSSADISSWPNGIYLLKAASAGRVITQRVLKQ